MPKGGDPMATRDKLGIERHFGGLQDPRVGPLHPLIELVTIAICGVICRADDWVAIAEFGQARYE